MQQSSDIDEVFENLNSCDEETKLEKLKSLQLRYFSPREIGQLMGFPNEFKFPDDTTRMQRYRVLGNSLSVDVVALLIKISMVSK